MKEEEKKFEEQKFQPQAPLVLLDDECDACFFFNWLEKYMSCDRIPSCARQAALWLSLVIPSKCTVFYLMLSLKREP